MRSTQDGDVRTSARVTVHTFKHICSLPLVHRPKGVLLVGIPGSGVATSLRLLGTDFLKGPPSVWGPHI